MIDVVAFDFGNVLGRFDHHRACRQIAELTSAGVALAPRVYAYIYEAGRNLPLEGGRQAAEVFLADLGREFGLDDHPRLSTAYNQIFTRDELVCGLLARVKPPKLLASNTDPLHWEVISQMFAGDLTAFAAGGLVRSYDVGWCKPAPEFFAAVLRTARQVTGNEGLAAERILLIDDLAANCAAAQAAGFQVHQHDSAASLEARLREQDLLRD